jgi:hypothetical protein
MAPQVSQARNMLALPECGLLVSWDMTAPLLVVSHPHVTGVFAPQPPCSNPGFGTTFAANASPDAGNANARATSATVIGSLIVICLLPSNVLRGQLASERFPARALPRDMRRDPVRTANVAYRRYEQEHPAS